MPTQDSNKSNDNSKKGDPSSKPLIHGDGARSPKKKPTRPPKR